MVAELTIQEAITVLDPVMTADQLRTLLHIAAIEPCGNRRTRRVGRPSATYPAADLMRVHSEEANRTSKQFKGHDWLASALLARGQLTANPEAGELWWADGTRAERLRPDYYGEIRVGPCSVGAHRVIWIAAEGEIASGIQVNHINRRRWDNRRVNLELVTFGNNIRHAHGTPYLNTSQAAGRLATLESGDPEIPPSDIHYQVLQRVAGVFRHAPYYPSNAKFR